MVTTCSMYKYINTDQHIHCLCQTIAKANRTFAQKREDDSHTNLYYDSIGNRIFGRWIETPKGKIILSLNLRNLQYDCLNTSLQTEKSFISIGKTANTVEKEMEAYLIELDMNPAGFRNDLHFKITDYPFKSDPIGSIDKEHIEAWKHYRQLANDACAWLLGHLQQLGEVRIWPHHFDTGIYVIPNENLGLGFGMAMEDTMVGTPYFYLSGYPLQGDINYTHIPKLIHGKWEIGENWNGAVLPLQEIAHLNSEQARKIIIRFIKNTSNWFLV